MPPRVIDRKVELAVLHQQVIVGGSEVDRAGLDPLLVFDIDHRHFRRAPQERGQTLVRLFVPMLHHGDGDAEVVGQTAEDDLHRLHTAERTADDDQVIVIAGVAAAARTAAAARPHRILRYSRSSASITSYESTTDV